MRKILYILTALAFFAVATPDASAQKGAWKNGTWTKLTNDTTAGIGRTTHYDIIRDSIYKTIKDSLERIPRSASAGTMKDTITLAARWQAPYSDDTARAVFFNDVYEAGESAFRFLAVSHAMSEWRVVSVAVTHEHDSASGSFYNDRDTLAAAANAATIPRGSHVFIVYAGAASYSGTYDQRSQHAAQEVGVFYILPNGNGAVLRACDGVQVPLILGFPGWSKGLGMRDATNPSGPHWLSVTIKLVGV